MLPQQFVSFVPLLALEKPRKPIHIPVNSLYFCSFTRYYYFPIVYYTLRYMSVLNGIAEASMQDAIEMVKALPHYATKGEVHVQVLFLYLLLSCIQWVMTDARHDSTSNAFHTTVPCITGRYKVHVNEFF